MRRVAEHPLQLVEDFATGSFLAEDQSGNKITINRRGAIENIV